jgi:hypothetical protein
MDANQVEIVADLFRNVHSEIDGAEFPIWMKILHSAKIPPFVSARQCGVWRGMAGESGDQRYTTAEIA